MRSSKAAFDLIVAEEVTSQSVYTKKYRRPEWPGASSGATVGIGYDLGQTPESTVRADWQSRVDADMLEAMVSACGETAAAGKRATARIKNKVDIPWDVALEVHEECVIPRWEARVLAALPNSKKLHPDCFGALLSLTFNRGPSFKNSGERYREMRAIASHIAAEDFEQIPDELRAMKRLWPNLVGLRKRRDREAALFEQGLASSPAEPAAPAVNKTVVAARTVGGGTAAVVAASQVVSSITGPAVQTVEQVKELVTSSGDVVAVSKQVVTAAPSGFWSNALAFVQSPKFLAIALVVVCVAWAATYYLRQFEFRKRAE